jgi:hypothetical protein
MHKGQFWNTALRWSALGPVETKYSNQTLRTLWEGAAMLHPHARVRTRTHTRTPIESLHQLNFEVLKYPPYASSTYLIHSKTLQEASILPVTEKWKKWCTHGLSLNQKYFFWGHTEICDLLD